MPTRRTTLKPALLSYSAFILASALVLGSAHAQTPDPGTQPDTQQPTNPDADVVGATPSLPKTPAQLKVQAWTLLSDALADLKHPDTRIQALAALGMLGNNPRSLKMIEDAMADHDVDVRTASVIAAGQTGSPAITSSLRRMLDDKEPQVAYSAALGLWKMNDHSGEDILMSVVDGDRRASATLVNGTEHTMSRDLHSPSTLAKIGALQGASMLLGPFGIGITAYEYIRKNGGNSARVSAIEVLSQEKTEPLRLEFIAALGDKDPSVRAAASKALDSYHTPETAKAIAQLFVDPKTPVRLTAASAYLISTNASPSSPDPNAKKSVTSHKSH
jgi:HEAT repeat protein